MQDSIFAETATRILTNAAAAPDGGFDAPLWKLIEEAGLDRLLLPEEMDGAGDAFAEAAAVTAAFGRAGASVPMVETVVANWCLGHAGLDVPPGPKALMIAPQGAELSSGGFLPPASAPVCAVWMPVASVVVVVAPDDTGATAVATLADEAKNKAGDKNGESVAGEPLTWLSPDGPIGLGPAGRLRGPAGLPLALAAFLTSAAIVGAIDRASELTIDYANTRKQFGRAISRFQAVQHMAARMASESAAARAAVDSAVTGLSGPDPLWVAAVAKSRASEAAGLVAADAHQIHGAIGFTREYELHRHTRRLWAWRERYGNERHWNERIGRLVIQTGGQDLWAGLVNGMRL